MNPPAGDNTDSLWLGGSKYLRCFKQNEKGHIEDYMVYVIRLTTDESVCYICRGRGEGGEGAAAV